MRELGMHRTPTQVASDETKVEEWVYDIESTHYRAFVIKVGTGGFVLVTPGNGAVGARANLRREVWFPLGRNTAGGYLSETYVAEKTGSSGADSHALTTLIAAATGREPIYLTDTVEPQEGT